jgi:hypothetical protein
LTSYLFEFVPPVGKGRNRISVRVARLASEDEARSEAKALMDQYRVQKVKIYKVGPNGESFPVATLPEDSPTSE